VRNVLIDIETATWDLYYSARSTYGPLLGGIPATQPLGPAFWHNVTEIFETSDAAFQMYQTFRTRGVSPIKCDAKCKAVTICDMQAMRAENGCVSQKVDCQSLSCSVIFPLLDRFYAWQVLPPRF
jgi:sphingomyelin phosphodiesterase